MGSSPAVGSSRISTSGLMASTPAMAALRFLLPKCQRRFGKQCSLKPNKVGRFDHTFFISSSERPMFLGPKEMSLLQPFRQTADIRGTEKPYLFENGIFLNFFGSAKISSPESRTLPLSGFKSPHSICTRGGFSRTGMSYYADDLALFHRKAHVGDGVFLKGVPSP